jgi:hypothetical protein
MKKYFLANGTEISEQQKQEIERKNQEILNSGDFMRMMDIEFIYTEEYVTSTRGRL